MSAANVPDLDVHHEGELAPLLLRLRAHEQQLGRPVRVLHIGNIANNAFHNAKLLRRAGLDCDVICYDYYHIMGCPEWEDADLDSDIGDHFHPQWYRHNLHGYRRPKWFVQGPVILCINYLLACRQGDARKADRLWRILSLINCTSNVTINERSALTWRKISDFFNRAFQLLLQPDRVREKFDQVTHAWLPSGSTPRRLTSLLLRTLRKQMETLSTILAELLVRKQRHRDRSGKFFVRARDLCREFAEVFPERDDHLRMVDTIAFVSLSRRWGRLFKHYDIVQGYSIDPIIPMLANRPYFAFEHGTLREIPDQRDARGRLTSLAYHEAEHVFVTNSDCLANAHRLAGDRVTFINHPFDEDDAVAVKGWEKLREELRTQLDADFLFFHPTRQDWVPGTGYADKANDVFLKAFAAMRGQGLRVGAVMCTWGRNVNASRALLQDLQVDRYVYWEAPMAMRKFFRIARACDIVVDQFKLGAFGGVTFKSLAAGVPVCTRLDEQEARRSFGVAPPVINCATTEDLLRVLPPLLQDGSRLERLSHASREWIEQHHSGRQVAAAQLRAYLDYLDASITSASAR